MGASLSSPLVDEAALQNTLESLDIMAHEVAEDSVPNFPMERRVS